MVNPFLYLLRYVFALPSPSYVLASSSFSLMPQASIMGKQEKPAAGRKAGNHGMPKRKVVLPGPPETMRDYIGRWKKCIQKSRDPRHVLRHLNYIARAILSGEMSCNRGQFNKTGLAAVVVGAMATHADKPDILRCAFWIAQQLTDHCGDFRAVLENSLTHVFAAMQKHQDHAVLMETAMFTLATLIHVNKGDHATLLRDHVADVVEVILAHADNSNIASSACVVLHRLLTTIQSLDEENETNRVVCTNVWNGLATIMGRSPKPIERKVLHTAMSAIEHLAIKPSANKLIGNPALPAPSTMVDPVLEAMKIYEDVPFLNMGFAALASMARWPSYTNSILVHEKAVFEFICEILRKHTHEPKVLRPGCILLGRLMLPNEVQLPSGRPLDLMIRCLVTILEAHSTNILVLAPVCFVINILAFRCSASRLQLIENGARAMIAAALKAQPRRARGWPSHGKKALDTLAAPFGRT
jgi:hypothetical protein